MPQLTIDQLAARAAKKRNNRVKKELPLLAAAGAIPEGWMTTEAEQKVRIEHQHQEAQDRFAQIVKDDEERRILSERCKAECRELVSEEQFAEMERGTRYIDQRPPVYALDYWRRQLARLDPRYCPHYKNGHYVSKALGHARCPVCLQEVE